MPSNHLILCHPLLFLPPIFPSIKVFSSESALHIRWPKYWSFSFSINPSNEYSGLISFRMDWLDPINIILNQDLKIQKICQGYLQLFLLLLKCYHLTEQSRSKQSDFPIRVSSKKKLLKVTESNSTGRTETLKLKSLWYFHFALSNDTEIPLSQSLQAL